MALTMSLQSAKLELGVGLSLKVSRMGGMGTRPAPDTSWPPTTFVYTGEHEVECAVSREQSNEAHGILLNHLGVPCTLWLKPDVSPIPCTFTASGMYMDMDGGTLTGIVYQDSYNGKPVTDPAMVAYLIEQYKPKPLTPEEEAQLDADLAFYDGE
jgi:hypothetical protein